MKATIPDSSFICPKREISRYTDCSFCCAFGGGLAACDGRSPDCRIRERKLRRQKRKLTQRNWLQEKRGIVPHMPTPVESFVGAINNLIPHRPHQKSDETAMEREASQEQPESSI